MAQGLLPFQCQQYQDQNRASGLTALAGLPAYLDLAQAAYSGESGPVIPL